MNSTFFTAELASCALLWQRRPVAGLLARLLPPVVASALLLRSDLEPLAQAVCARYVLVHMPSPAQAMRAPRDVLAVAQFGLLAN